MGNSCVGPSISKNGIILSFSAAIWRTHLPEPEGSVANRGSVNDVATDNEPESPLPVQNKPPEQITIPKPDAKQESECEKEPEKEKKKERKPSVKRSSSAGLRVDSVLQRETGNFKDYFSLGEKLGQENEQGIFEQVFHGDLDFASDPWPAISESAKDLVRKMLVRDPRRRMTAYQVLCHPWVQVDGVAPDKPLDSAVLSRLKQFSAMNKLKKMALIVSLSMQKFRSCFEYNDDYSKCVKLKVFHYGFGANLKESEIYDLMQAADIDNSGTIDYGEFIAATLHLNKVEREDHLFATFSYFDKDGSGYITQEELQQACDEFGIKDVGLDEIIKEIDEDNVETKKIVIYLFKPQNPRLCRFSSVLFWFSDLYTNFFVKAVFVLF
ncbi:hypothetical protein RYX36_014324 [Vicia faba]